MNSLIYLTIIACVSVTGEALTCIKNSSSEYFNPAVPTEECWIKPLACVLQVTTWSNGAVTTRRQCATGLDALLINEVDDNNNIVKSINTFVCTTDMCNETPPTNSCNEPPPTDSTNHAQLVSPNFIIFAFTLCTLFITVKAVD